MPSGRLQLHEPTRQFGQYDRLLTDLYLDIYTFLTTFSCGPEEASYHLDS